MRVRKEMWFEAAHKLTGTGGPCDRLHGHSYRVTVEVEGVVIGGMVANFDAIEKVILALDHQYLNELPQFVDHQTTAENIALWLRDSVRELGTFSDVSVTVEETRGSSVVLSRG